MSELSVRVVELVRKNTATLLMFAFSRQQLVEIAEQRLVGEWAAYRRTLLELPQARAERACFELALFLRQLDDDKRLSQHVVSHSNLQLGILSRAGKPDEPLPLRDVANKIIHSARFDWDFSQTGQPQLVCIPRDAERWTRANIDLLNLACVSGNLADAWGAR
jgi:hypothetical protein